MATRRTNDDPEDRGWTLARKSSGSPGRLSFIAIKRYYPDSSARAGPAMIPISFEFYPPKTDEQRAQLDRTVKKLKAHAPEYVSCTFGAGGSTLDHTPETIHRLHGHHGLDAAPHISCVGGSRAEIA